MKHKRATLESSIDDACKLLARLQTVVGNLTSVTEDELVQKRYDELRAEADRDLAIKLPVTVLGGLREMVRKEGEERHRRQQELNALDSRSQQVKELTRRKGKKPEPVVPTMPKWQMLKEREWVLRNGKK